MTISEKIIELRKEKKMSKLELSKKAKISNITLTNIEKGYHHPTAKTLYALAKALDYDFDVLFEINKEGN